MQFYECRIYGTILHHLVRFGTLNELLYANDLVLMSETIMGLGISS